MEKHNGCSLSLSLSMLFSRPIACLFSSMQSSKSLIFLPLYFIGDFERCSLKQLRRRARGRERYTKEKMHFPRSSRVSRCRNVSSVFVSGHPLLFCLDIIGVILLALTELRRRHGSPTIYIATEGEIERETEREAGEWGNTRKQGQKRMNQEEDLEWEANWNTRMMEGEYTQGAQIKNASGSVAFTSHNSTESQLFQPHVRPKKPRFFWAIFYS